MGVIVGAAALLLILYFLIPYITRSTKNKALKKVLKKSRVGAMGFALTILFFLWMRFESISFFSMRLWMYLTFLGLLVWIVWKVKRYLSISRRITKAEARRGRS